MMSCPKAHTHTQWSVDDQPQSILPMLIYGSSHFSQTFNETLKVFLFAIQPLKVSHFGI